MMLAFIGGVILGGIAMAAAIFVYFIINMHVQ